MTTTTTRPAEPDDLPRLLQIRHAAFTRHAPTVYSPEEVRTLLADVDEAELREMITERRLFVARYTEEIRRTGRLEGRPPAPCLRRPRPHPPLHRHDAGCPRRVRPPAPHRRQPAPSRRRLQAEPSHHAIGDELIAHRRAWDGSTYLEMSKPLDATPPTPNDPTT
jgi:hypothetical protein